MQWVLASKLYIENASMLTSPRLRRAISSGLPIRSRAASLPSWGKYGFSVIINWTFSIDGFAWSEASSARSINSSNAGFFMCGQADHSSHPFSSVSLSCHSLMCSEKATSSSIQIPETASPCLGWVLVEG